MQETEVKRAVAAQILSERKTRLGQITEAERDDATQKAWEHCENLARQRNPSETNLARAIHSKIYRELEVYKDDDLQRVATGSKA
jgi:hypothetical protein